jgi:hypothetical protein
MSEEEPLLADRVARLPDGGIALRLVEREREILRALLADLSLVVGAPPLPTEPWDADGRRVAGADEWPDDPDRAVEPAADTDPAADDAGDAGDTADDDLDDLDIADIRARLYPSAAPEDPRADEAYRRLVHEDLEAGRRARIAIVEATLDAQLIDDEQAEAWLHTLNDLRLVLGTRLTITEDAESEEFDAEDPDAAARVVYAYTGWLEGQFVDVLAAALPDAEDPSDEPHEPPSDDDPDASARRDDT